MGSAGAIAGGGYDVAGCRSGGQGKGTRDVVGVGRSCSAGGCDNRRRRFKRVCVDGEGVTITEGILFGKGRSNWGPHNNARPKDIRIRGIVPE